jgi:drug/metabolite transporter (DMT)-like permease
MGLWIISLSEFPTITVESMPSNNNAQFGILLIVVATTTFAISGTISRHLAMNYPVPVIVAIRFIIVLVLLWAFAGPRLGRELWKTTRTRLVTRTGIATRPNQLIASGLASHPWVGCFWPSCPTC